MKWRKDKWEEKRRREPKGGKEEKNETNQVTQIHIQFSPTLSTNNGGGGRGPISLTSRDSLQGKGGGIVDA